MLGPAIDMSDWMWWEAILDALNTLVGRSDDFIRVIGPSPRDPPTRIEVVLPTAPLTEALRGFSWRIFSLSLVISVIRSEEHTSELQSLMRISYAVFCLKKKKRNIT